MKVEILEQQHPDRQGLRIERCRALADGGDCWHHMKSVWLPKNAKEPAELYSERMERATYENIAGPLLNMLSAYLFKTPPTVDGLDDDWGKAFLASVDRRNTGWSQFWTARFLDALIGRRVLVWVNLPARAPDVVVTDRAAEEQAGLLDAYLVGVTPEELLDWGEDARGGLVWVLIRQIVDSRAGVDSARSKSWRWTYIDAKQIRTWTWTATPTKSAPEKNDEATEEPVIAHNAGRLPVVRIELPPGLWAGSQLHDPAVAHLRGDNDLGWALHKAAHALMFVQRKWGGEDPTLGPGYYMQLEPDDKVGWTEPPGNSFNILRDRVGDLRDAMHRVVHQMALSVDNSSARIRNSGESKQADWQASDIVMSAYAEQVLAAMRECASIVGALRGAGTVDVRGLDGWQQLTLDEFLGNAALAVNAAKYSPTFRREVAKREVEQLLPDLSPEVLEQIRKEIDEAPEDEPIGPPSGPGDRPPE